MQKGTYIQSLVEGNWYICRHGDNLGRWSIFEMEDMSNPTTTTTAVLEAAGSIDYNESLCVFPYCSTPTILQQSFVSLP